MVAFNITKTNGTKPIDAWLERGIQEFAKREYGLNITVEVIEDIESDIDLLEKEA